MARSEEVLGPARGVLPDVVTAEALIFIKACSRLRCTNELRRAVPIALAHGKAVVIIMTPSCIVEQDLEAFAKEHGIALLRREM